VEILLIEDTEDDSDYINELLNRMPGFLRKAVVCSSLSAARKTLGHQHFDAIILDINLPDSSGLETFESVKRIADRTPIVILTGQEDERLAFEALRLGAQDYLFKNALSLEGMRRSLVYAIERQRALESISLLATIVDSCTDAVASETLDGTILTWNRGATELYGFRQDEAVGKKIHDLLKSQQSTPFADVVAELIKNGRWQAQFVRQTKDGREIIVSSRWALRRDSSGQPLAMMLMSDPTSNQRLCILVQSLSLPMMP
jgi:two-component system, cell cycle sensor histidine kinase and response regulator CckA